MNEDFDSQCDSLEELLKRYRPKWQLSALAWIDYDDVCQIIRFHIYKKWHLWDQTRPFKPWASMIISNQIKNLIRNNYTNFGIYFHFNYLQIFLKFFNNLKIKII